VKRQKDALKQLKKATATHRETVKSLKVDLNKVRKTREAVSSDL
jgi:archaellum component FlaC